MTYLVAAYVVLWAVSFGLVISMVLRQRQVRAELDALRMMIDGESDLRRDEGMR